MTKGFEAYLLCLYSTASFASIRAIDTRDVHERHMLRIMCIPADVMRQRKCKLEIQCKFDAWCLGMMLSSYLRNMFDVRWRMRFLNGFRAFWSIAAFLYSTDALIAFSLWRHWRFLRRAIFSQSSLNDIIYFCGLINCAISLRIRMTLNFCRVLLWFYRYR